MKSTLVDLCTSVVHDPLLTDPCCHETSIGLYREPINGWIILTSLYIVKSMPANEAAITATRQPLKFVEAADWPNSASTQQ
jgi:hypothetical protein